MVNMDGVCCMLYGCSMDVVNTADIVIIGNYFISAIYKTKSCSRILLWYKRKLWIDCFFPWLPPWMFYTFMDNFQ